MAVPAVQGPFVNVVAAADPGGWPDGAWINLRLVEGAWPAPEGRTVLVIGGLEHVVDHTIGEIGAALALIS